MEEPTPFVEVTNDGNWQKTMIIELEAVKKNGMWKLTSLPYKKQIYWSEMGV